jgi:signal transduction histidine kinase
MALAETTFKPVIKREWRLEPGLLPIFRIFNLLPSLGAIGFFMALIFPTSVTRHYSALFPGLFSTLFVSYILISDTIKLVYLFWPHLPKKLGPYYLPVGIVLGTLTPLLRAFFVLQANPMWFYQNFPREVFQAYFVIPLIFIAWQYGFRSILTYCAFLALFEVYTYLQLLPLGVDLWVILQSSILLIVSNAIIGYIINRLVLAQRKQREELTRANTQLLHYSHALEQLAESRERNRLARELHDTLAHYMSGTILQLNGVKTLWEKNDVKAKIMLGEAVETLSQGLDETRHAIQTLRSSPVKHLGLAESLRDLANQYADKLGLELKLELEPIQFLPATIGQSLYPIAQEMLRNIERHAGAKQVSIKLKQQGHHVLLEVDDDGQGFDTDTLDRTRHFGLLGLEERAALLDGDVSIHSRPGQGTRVEIRIPLEKS